jgi:DNA-binding NtrC family response regulator
MWMTANGERGLKLLVIDDEHQNLGLIQAALEQHGLEILTADDAETGLALFQEHRPEIVLLDLIMPKMSGMEVLQKILAIDPATEVILMTAYYKAESAVEAIHRGAADYLTKPLDVIALGKRVSKLVEENRQRRLIGQLDKTLVETFQFEGIVGRSPLIIDMFSSLRRIAPHYRTALITGDTGTGKELAAQALHRLSPAADRIFAVCNSSALVDTLFESELFGHVRGAFTGANQDKVGLFEYANQGTVFLDEIGDMPLQGQAKLLRVLQNQEVQRVGSPVVRKVDVRVIAATNRDLRTMVRQNKFREDLYYRLSMTEIHLPRLAERKEDLPLLQRYFVEKFSTQYGKSVAGITRRAQALLARYNWPGNVRELENVIGNACMMMEGTVIDVKNLPSRFSEAPDLSNDDELLTIDEMQGRHVLRVLDRVGGDKSRAAEVLGIARSTLYNILAKISPTASGHRESSERLGPRAV